MRVAIVGGGIVGLCCAYELAQAGAEVTVVERGQVGEGASLGNTGWVCPSFSYPLPAPGIIGEGLRGMLRGGPPRHPPHAGPDLPPLATGFPAQRNARALGAGSARAH